MEKVIGCKGLAGRLKAEVLEGTAALAGQGIVPGLATLLVGDDFGSRMYRAQVERDSEAAGFRYFERTLPANAPEEHVVEVVEELNSNSSVHGILPLRPFPSQISDSVVIGGIAEEKDIDCFHPANMGRLLMGESTHAPATAAACMEILDCAGVDLAGKDLVIIGRSNSVGRPLAALGLVRNATVTVTHSYTSRAGMLEEHTARADVLVAAIGKPGMITSRHVKEGAVVIDVGINQVPVLGPDGTPELDSQGRQRMKTVGDVDFDDVSGKASLMTAVPGGVGLVTNMVLLRSCLEAARKQAGDRRK